MSPIDYIPNAAWARIRKAAISMLRADLELSERFPNHPLANYDAQHAKDELDAQLVQYSSTLYPFDRPLAQGQTVRDWWNVFFLRPDTRIIGVCSGFTIRLANANSPRLVYLCEALFHLR
jgi:hypothetical protein